MTEKYIGFGTKNSNQLSGYRLLNSKHSSTLACKSVSTAGPLAKMVMNKTRDAGWTRHRLKNNPGIPQSKGTRENNSNEKEDYKEP